MSSSCRWTCLTLLEGLARCTAITFVFMARRIASRTSFADPYIKELTLGLHQACVQQAFSAPKRALPGWTCSFNPERRLSE